ncbi:unnamed protein product [Staurois parvus]|uniref:Uncharacterized protein n=1 Tax=Staurois parvus TaxID=386267 RepID=A0ABN9GNF6_9NEOB|nr:unnamed protein product [Staurois parvus]
MQGPGRQDIMNAGSGGTPDIVNAGVRGVRWDIVNVGSGESGYSECRVPRRPDIVNAGSGETADIMMRGLGTPQI